MVTEPCRIGGVNKTPVGVGKTEPGSNLSTLAADPAGQLHVLGHDGHTLGVDSSQVGVLKQADQVGLSSLLQRQHCRALEAQVCFEVLGNLTNQPLEWQLPVAHSNIRFRALSTTAITRFLGTVTQCKYATFILRGKCKA